jgi:hypothetical protein
MTQPKKRLRHSLYEESCVNILRIFFIVVHSSWGGGRGGNTTITQPYEEVQWSLHWSLLRSFVRYQHNNPTRNTRLPALQSEAAG